MCVLGPKSGSKLKAAGHLRGPMSTRWIAYPPRRKMDCPCSIPASLAAANLYQFPLRLSNFYFLPDWPDAAPNLLICKTLFKRNKSLAHSLPCPAIDSLFASRQHGAFQEIELLKAVCLFSNWLSVKTPNIVFGKVFKLGIHKQSREYNFKWFKGQLDKKVEP